MDNTNGIIQSTGGSGIAIQAGATGAITVSNAGDGITTGIISATARAFQGQAVTVTGNSGKIETTDPTGIAIQASQTATVTNLANGLITGPASGISAQTSLSKAMPVLIEATGTGGIAINATGDATVTNSKTIQSPGGIAILAGGKATVNNLSGAIIRGSGGVSGGTLNVTNAAGASILVALASSGRRLGDQRRYDLRRSNVRAIHRHRHQYAHAADRVGVERRCAGRVGWRDQQARA